MGDATFVVTDPKQIRTACQAGVAAIAEQVAARAAANSPRRFGRLAAGFRTQPGYDDPGTTVVVNSVPYARFIEYGTRHMRAYAPLGRAAAG
jgi:Bacteriophage HK97-gp10, putative tail-component